MPEVAAPPARSEARGAATAPMMRAEGITLRFGGVTALSEVSFEVGASEIHAIIGPNGAGKSCALNCLNGFNVPQLGSLFFGEKEITGLAPHRIARLGVGRTFQGLQLFAGLTVVDNLLTGRHMHMKTGALQASAPPRARQVKPSVR